MGKMGHERDCSFEFSNLLAFDGGADPDCNISKMVFSRPANPTAAPIDVNIISVKRGKAWFVRLVGRLGLWVCLLRRRRYWLTGYVRRFETGSKLSEPKALRLSDAHVVLIVVITDNSPGHRCMLLSLLARQFL